MTRGECRQRNILVLHQPKNKMCQDRKTCPPIVSPIERVGGGEDGAPGVEGGGDACFGDRNRLLLHHLLGECLGGECHDRDRD